MTETDRDNRNLDPEAARAEKDLDYALRPRGFDDFVGQKKVVDLLRVFIAAARKRGEVLDHVLLSSPPGLGKTTLAHIIANELNVGLHVSSGPAVEKKGDLAGLLTSLQKGDVLFIDEIHRLSAVVEENLYPAMEDFRYDFIIGEGPAARSFKLALAPFTLIGATTRTGLLSSPLRDRFQIPLHLDFYPPEDLELIVRRSANLLEVEIDDEAAVEISRRSRGTPRITNRLLRRVRDFAEIRGNGRITLEMACYALERLEVDKRGLDAKDRATLRAVVEMFDGGPVGLKTLAAVVGDEPDTLEDVYEPYLIQMGFLQRTARGRTATRAAYEHLGLKPPRRAEDFAGQFGLFEEAEKAARGEKGEKEGE